ncbi:MAG: Brp/Blh family beta-carotene 15,15'-dioxygenase [Planctomycetota bacterium]
MQTLIFPANPVLVVTSIYLTLALAASVVCQLISVDAFSPSLLIFSAVLIGLLGVPHGGLDHRCGRRWLKPVLGKRWTHLFFISYLAVAALVTIAWFTFPRVTVLGFLVLSAWHFGREENVTRPTLRTIAAGGLIIWAIAVFRTSEMVTVLSATIGENSTEQAEQIVQAARLASLLALPAGLFWASTSAAKANGVAEKLIGLLIPVVTVVLAAVTPIVVSFTVYFCFWHSLLGLRRLKTTHQLGTSELMIAVAPISAVAVSMIVGVHGIADAGLSLEVFRQSVVLRMLFVGLASIAVPHILLHECGPWLAVKTARPVHDLDRKVLA